MLLALGSVAAAEPPLDGPVTWFGGKVVTGLHLAPGGPALVASQAEADARIEVDEALAFRADLDVHLPATPLDGPRLAPRFLPPEALFVRVGRATGVDLRLGVTIPEIGVECWDPDENDLASYSLAWELENGQLLGAEPGIRVGDALRMFVFAGQDLAWGTPTVGGGLSGSLAPVVETWSGGFWLPQERYLLLISGNQAYLADDVWLTGEIYGGYADGTPTLGGQLGLTVDTRPFGGAIRLEHQRVDPRALIRRYDIELAYPTAVTAGVRVWVRDAFGLVVEARERLGPGGPVFEGTVLLTARTPGEPMQADRARDR